MIAPDTNILARFLPNDDTAQFKQARALLGPHNFKPKSFEAVCYEVNWYETGMDFGDAPHLAPSAGEGAFATFDKALGRVATQNGIAPQVQVLRC